MQSATFGTQTLWTDFALKMYPGDAAAGSVLQFTTLGGATLADTAAAASVVATVQASHQTTFVPQFLARSAYTERIRVLDHGLLVANQVVSAPPTVLVDSLPRRIAHGIID